MRLRSPTAGYGLLVLTALAGVVAAAIMLADGAQARYGLSGGEARISSALPRSQPSKARGDKPQRSSARERSRGAARMRVERRAAAAAREKAKSPAPPPKPPCERNVEIAASKGLRLPDGWELHCVGPGLDWEGGTHWGVTCRYDECPEGAGPYVSISNPTYYVVTHELCHANFGDDEAMADSCAAKHGASLATSPYS